MTPHPESDRLRAALGRCGRWSTSWTGIVYRSASVRYANRDDLLTGAGSKESGARWNPPGSVATLYAALDAATALAETGAHNRYFGIPEEMAYPRVLVSIRVSLQRLLDLTVTPLRRVLGVTRERLLQEDWRAANASGEEALTQALGRLGQGFRSSRV